MRTFLKLKHFIGAPDRIIVVVDKDVPTVGKFDNDVFQKPVLLLVRDLASVTGKRQFEHRETNRWAC